MRAFFAVSPLFDAQRYRHRASLAHARRLEPSRGRGVGAHSGRDSSFGDRRPVDARRRRRGRWHDRHREPRMARRGVGQRGCSTRPRRRRELSRPVRRAPSPRDASGADVARSAVARVLQGEGRRCEALYSSARPTGPESRATAKTDSWFTSRVRHGARGRSHAMAVVTHEDVTTRASRPGARTGAVHRTQRARGCGSRRVARRASSSRR